MKKLIATAITFASASAATAGSVVYTPPVATMLEEPERMGGSGAWIIPLIIATIIVFAVTQTSDTPVATNGQN